MSVDSGETFASATIGTSIFSNFKRDILIPTDSGFQKIRLVLFKNLILDRSWLLVFEDLLELLEDAITIKHPPTLERLSGLSH